MGKASSSKKVQRAARAAASSRGASERRELGFPMVVGLVIILGIGLVLAARSSRDPLLPPRTSDHWHAAYTFYECGIELPSFQGVADPDGIHSHQDGLIHIHPFNSSATGEDAQLEVFLDAMEVSVTDVAMESTEFGRIEAADGCNGEPGVIKGARWDPDGDEGVELVEIFESDFSSIRFEQDREAFTFALVPAGEDPPPPSAASLAQLDATTGGALQSEGPVSFEDAVANTSTTTPVDDTGDPATDSEDPATDSEEPTTEDPATDSEDPATNTGDPATNTGDPATNSEEPTTEDPATEGGEPTGDDGE